MWHIEPQIEQQCHTSKGKFGEGFAPFALWEKGWGSGPTILALRSTAFLRIFKKPTNPIKTLA
jgi:hypothetical protein